MTKSNGFLLACSTILAGIGFARAVPDASLWLSAGGCCLGLCLLMFQRRPLWLIIVVFGLSLGFGRAALVAKAPVIGEGERKLSGFIVAAPDLRTDGVRYTVELEFQVNILVRSALEPRYTIGDRVAFSCQVRRPEPVETFAYDRYLALDGIRATCTARHIELLESGSFSVSRAFAAGRNRVEQKLNQLYQEPEASFAAGLLIGARRGLPVELKEAFNRTGTTHLIALSGFNIAIVSTMILRSMVGIVGRKKAFWLVLAGVSLFVVFVGAQASIVRAGIMGLVAAFGQYVGRPSRGLNLLALSATLMVGLQPAILLDDVSFQLSFASTLGLMLITPAIAPLTSWLPEQLGLRDNVTSTLSATLGTLPIILATFGRLSLVALPVNLLILSFIPLAMGLVALAWVGSLFGLSVGLLAGLPGWMLLHVIIAVVRFFAEPSWSSLSFGVLGPPAYLLLIPVFGGALWLDRRRRHV